MPGITIDRLQDSIRLVKQEMMFCLTKRNTGENPEQMRYRDCWHAWVGNLFFIDNDDSTQTGSGNSSTATSGTSI